MNQIPFPFAPFPAFQVESQGEATRTAGGPLESLADWVASPIISGSQPTPEAEAKVAAVASLWSQIKVRTAADPKTAHVVQGYLDHWTTFYGNWQAGKKDINDLNTVTADANAAADYAGIRSYNAPDALRGIDLDGEVKNELAHNVEHKVTAPFTQPWCQTIGLPKAICGDTGLEPWFLWTLGLTGAVLVGGAAYVAVKAGKAALPFALAAYAPGALPAYQAYQEGGTEAVKPHVLKAIQEAQAR